MSEWHYNPSHGDSGPVQFGMGTRGPAHPRDQKFPLSSGAGGAGASYHSAGSVTLIHESVSVTESTRTQYSVVPVHSSMTASVRGSVDFGGQMAGGQHQHQQQQQQQYQQQQQVQHSSARAALASGVHRVHLAEATPQSFSYSSTGAVNWKALWNALLSGQHNALRRWVAELPIKGCKVDAAGRLDVASSVLPATFALQLNEMLAKAVPPLADLVIDALCWRGIFLPSELCNFDLLSVRLARNGLLCRPAGRRELKPLSLEKFLPFAALAPFHRYMLTKRLRPDRFQYAVLRKAYVAWYKLGAFVPEMDAIVARMERATAAAAGRAAGAKFLLDLEHQNSGAGGSAPMLLSTTAPLDTDLGTFVQGLGYIVGYDPETGAPLFGDEDAGVEALRAEQARADAELAASIDAEIDAMQSLVAEELTRPNFNIAWLRAMGVPQLRVHPVHLHHARVSRALNAEIDAVLPGGKSAVLKNAPTDQIVMLVLYALYRCSPTRALRIAAPMLAAAPGISYPLLAGLVAKLALACSGVRGKAAKRTQTSAIHFLKMAQQYVFALPPSDSRPEGDEDEEREPEQAPDASDPGATLHGMPLSQNEPLLLSMLLDVSALIARYSDAATLLNEPALAALLPPRGTHDLLASAAERAHMPALLWAVWVAYQRRRNSRVPGLARRMPPEDGSVDTEGPHDSAVIAWFLALLLHLYGLVAAQRRTVSAAPAAVAPRPAVDCATLAFHCMGAHMLALEAFPRGFGAVLRTEFALAGGPGGSAMFVRAFLWFGGLAQEEPPALVQRLLQLQAEKFFDGDWGAVGTAAGANGGFMEDLPDQSGSGRARRPLQGHACLQHLCVVLAPYSAILLASRPADSAEARATALQLQQRPSSVSAATAGAAGHAALVASESAPVWDPTSEALLRVAYDPFTAHVLGLSAPAKASYLLSRANGDAGVVTLACGIGASSADSMLAWLKRNQAELLAGLPELPAPGARGGPPAFHERSLPLEKALLRLVRAGSWYTLGNAFALFAPHNVLGHAVAFLKHFTQRRYAGAAQALQDTFATLAESRTLAQPNFGRRHFFAVVGAAGSSDTRERNGTAYAWTQRMLVVLVRAGLLIGMQGNIPSSHRMGTLAAGARAGAGAGAPRGGFTSIDLTDYDRNFLMDLFQGLLARHAAVGDDAAQAPAPTSIVLSQSMVNEILSVIPPTVSSSFLLNITSIAHNALLGVSRTQSQAQRLMVHRLKWRQHRHAMWAQRLQSWREQEGYYTRKMHELLALLDLERLVGVSLEERSRLIRFWAREQGELCVAPQICAALWYQAALHFYRATHTTPDALVPAVSNSSAEAARGDARAHSRGAGTQADAGAAAAAAANSVASASNGATDADGLRTGANVEQSTEATECAQEVVLLFLAHQSWQQCFDALHEDLERYFRAHPAARPVPVRLDNMPEGAAAAAGLAETTPALDNEGRPILLPAEIDAKLAQKSQYLFVLRRVRGRLYWLMLLHGMSNVRNKETSRVEFDLNDPAEVAAWRARQAEREAAAHQRATDRVIAAAEREAARRGRRDERTLRAQARALKRAAKQAQTPQPKSRDGGRSGSASMPPTPPDSDASDSDGGESDAEGVEARIRAREEEEERAALDADQDPDDDLHRPLFVEFAHVQRLHFAEGKALGMGATASPGGVSRGLEKFLPLPPGQYLPWNGSSLSNPSSAVLDAQAKHRAAAFAFDEDMDVTRLSAAEVALIGEYSVDTRLLLAVVEELLHLRMFRTALRVVADVVERFPLLRHTPRMQAALSLIDTLQLLFFVAHPSLQDVRVNQVLSGQSGAPFAGPAGSTQLSIAEELDPFARCYAELLDWPLVRHVLREEEQTWLRMRWSPANHSNHTLILQRILIDAPSLYQNIWISLLFARDGAANALTTVYSRTRPVAVELHANEAAKDGDGGGGGSSFARSLMGTMRSIGDAIKGTGGDTSRTMGSGAGAAGGPGGSEALDVEHLRQWLLTLDEAGRVELLDRFVQVCNDPLNAPLTASRSVAVASGAAATAATLGSPSHATGGAGVGVGGTSHARSPSTAGSRTGGHSEAANPHFVALSRRHLPLLCEVAQTLAMSLRVARVELIKPRNKKLAPLPPGLRVSGQQFMVVLASVLVKTRTLSARLPLSVPLHYSSRERLHPDRNAPTSAWALNLAENLSMPLLSLLGMHPAEIIHHLWTSGRGAERAAILTLLRSGQIYYHFMNHHNFASLDRDLHGADVCAALVEALLKAVTNADKRAGPPSPFRNFQQGEWWGREELVAYIGLADRSEPLALPTLAAAFRAQAFVLIKARDPSAAVTSALLGASGGGSVGADGVHDLGEAHSSASRVAAGLLGWWQGPRDPSRPFLHGHGLDEFLRLSPGTCVEFELLYASYLSFLAGGRVHEMRQVARDIRAGLQALLTCVQTKSRSPAPPVITSPTNPDEMIAPPFAGASLVQIEAVYLARLQLERAATIMCHDAEMRDVIAGLWRQFRKKAPQAFA